MNPEEFCKAHLGQDPGGIFEVQIERVWSYLIRREAGEMRPGADDVFTAFHKSGLVPQWLILSIQPSLAQPSLAQPSLANCPADAALATAYGLAVCFAACIFPQRTLMEITQLDLRLTAFLDFYQNLQALQESGERDEELTAAISQRFLNFPNPMQREEFDELAAELSAVPALYHQNEEEVRARKNGAALYLATCYPEQIERIHARWSNEREALHSVTKDFYLPPSCVGKKIRSLASPEAFKKASYLEYLARQSAHNHMPPGLNGAEERLQEKVIEFWETQRNKLISGFPYFSFQSNFATWWRQVLKNWDWEPWEVECGVESLPQAPAPPPDEDEEETWEVNLTTLRAWREGYRFLRLTFTRLRAGEDHEELRRALDEFWTHRLLTVLGGGAVTMKVQDIAKKFVNLGGNIINNLSHRLRARNQAYSRARIKRQSNNDIYQRQQESRKKWAWKRPRKSEDFDKEKAATFTVASLARATLPEFTFLWAFTAQVFLRPRVDRRHAEQWRFDRYARELWHWVTDPLFAGLIEHGARSGRQVDDIARRAMRSDGAFGGLVSELLSFQSEDGLDEYLRRRDPARYAKEETAARQLIARLIGPAGLCACGEEAMQRWKAMMDQINGAHWIIPVWYVTFVERIADDNALLERLVVDKPERGPVLRLAQAMRACGATSAPRGGERS
ncbi:MAG: hypothetical protein AB7U82_13555 [Blastocatellales bacterium]